ncbi:glycine-rich RNA-binding protein 2, mitochondrial-like [Actinidia eriantha]|uniref:glycine-rich RNA-binding protein 2, mitochondrial-like n=1 Tax=Actinidia eriantha TaxID=165200 RepID=UPI002585953D|nr:glycine-rich RNA-binding protein 2, mitochondrial-like [Actinidia eriantha]XP_057480532.1 glycine-rich RNA-binding protein 2, mitochondrial-like [Actinidia eriantha]
MAFFSKAGNILKQTVSKRINSEIYGSNPSIFQMIRCMSSSKVFIGGIAYSTDDTSLREAFDKYGEVVEARVIVDRETGRSRGFGFVTYTSGEEASAAIQALDGKELHGRLVRVNYANDRAPRSGGFGGGGYGYGGGGGGGYGGGGNYGNYGSGGGGYGGNNYGSGGSGDSYGGGNFGQGGNYGGGNQSFGVSGGAGGSDNYVSGDRGMNSSFTTSEFGGNTGLGYGGDQFGSNENSGTVDVAGGFSQDNPIEERNFRDNDDDEPDDYANKRA